MSVSICQQLKSYLIDEKLENAINIPFGGLSRIKDLELSLKLSETIGRIQSQINKGVIKKVQSDLHTDLPDASREERVTVVPNPTTADADDDFGFTTTIGFFDDGKSYNPKTGQDE